MENFKRRPGRDSSGRNSDRNSNRSGRDFGGRGDLRKSRQSPELHRVTCDGCGIECEVPFKPTSSKPVYCSDCFKKKDSGSRNNQSEQLNQINAKLDKILAALKISE